MHMEITGSPKNQDKFKQRKLKPSVSFQIQQSMKLLLPAIKRAENQFKKKASCRALSSTLFVLWRCILHVRITNNISLFCHLFPAPTSAWHQSPWCANHSRTSAEFPYMKVCRGRVWFITILQGEKMSKATFPFLWHPVCRENAYSGITCRYKLINEEIAVTSHYYWQIPFPNSPGKADKSK